MASSPAPSQQPYSLYIHRQGQGFPVLCLHGHPGSGAAMSVFTRFLSRQFATLAPDLRGYGRSRYPRPFTMANHLTDLRALLDQEGIEQCLVLGWSLGGILALELALQYPERIQGLILVATAAAPRSRHPAISWADQLYTGLASILNRARPGWRWNIDTFGRRSLYRYLLQQHSPGAYRYLAEEGLPAYLKTSRPAQQALQKALQAGYNRLDAIRQIQAPCLMLIGEQDYHIAPQASWETAMALPNCQQICYPNVAHLFPWEIPERLEADITTWIAEQPLAIATN
ncbi:MAG: alpha/beta hydrolase [Cyanobacteria bacterium P01_A01_bin.135]